VSALRAELTALNHKLPAEVSEHFEDHFDFSECFHTQVDIPMWTSGADSTHHRKVAVKGHNRIVRIPPGESVVLNSAERAPYLLIVEVLVGDLDFVPTKRSNKEILKRIAAKEDAEVLRRRSDADGARLSRSVQTNGRPSVREDSTALRGASFSNSIPTSELTGDDSGPSIPMSATTSVATSEPQEDEEMDLVEQLYGANVSVRTQGGDLSDSIVLPAAPKNKALDVAVWSKGSPLLSRSTSPNLQASTTPRQPDGPSIPASPFVGAAPSEPASPSVSTERSPRHQAPLSLEDYSERMRTAAIMLAQLNANLIREPVTTINAPTSTSNGATALSPPELVDPPQPNAAQLPTLPNWLPGSNWITGGRGRSGSQSQAPPPAMRMRLQYAEAMAIRDKIMQEMMALEEERMERMKEPVDAYSGSVNIGDSGVSARSVEDESIVRKELNKVDPSGARVGRNNCDDILTFHSGCRPRVVANQKIPNTFRLAIWPPRVMGCE